MLDAKKKPSEAKHNRQWKNNVSAIEAAGFKPYSTAVNAANIDM